MGSMTVLIDMLASKLVDSVLICQYQTIPCSAFEVVTSKQESTFNHPKLLTDLRILTGSFLSYLKVKEMSAALKSLDVFQICAMVKRVAEHLAWCQLSPVYEKPVQ